MMIKNPLFACGERVVERSNDRVSKLTYFTGGYDTHPDSATLVDPLCCAKRVEKENTPSFEEGRVRLNHKKTFTFR
jgi:hypothetical protein